MTWTEKFQKILEKKRTKKIIIGVISIFLFVGIFSAFSNDENNSLENNEQKRIKKVRLGNINQTIKVLGKAELVDEQKLRFNQIGKIAAVYFSDGDRVQKNEIIAELDKTEIFNDINQAEISLQNAKLSYQDVIKGNTEAQILKARNNVVNTEQNIILTDQGLEILKKDEKTTIKELKNEIALAEIDVNDKKRALETIKKDLENTRVFEDENIKNSSNNVTSSIDNALIIVKDSIIEMDDILTNINIIISEDDPYKNSNSNFKQNLGALNSSTFSNSKKSYKASKRKKDTLQSMLNSLVETNVKSASQVTMLLKAADEMLKNGVIASDNTFQLLEKSITSSSLSQSSLDSYKSSITSSRSSGQSMLSKIQSSLSSINNIESVSITELRSWDTVFKKEDSVQVAEYSLEKAKDALNKLKNTYNIKKESKRLEIITKENELFNLYNTLQAHEEELIELERGETRERKAIAGNDITQKKLALAKVLKNTEKFELISPFDGVLRKIDFKVGDNLIADEEKFVYIENPDLLKISILLDQIDIVKVKNGMKTRIVFDSLPEKTFVGQIEEIDQTPIIESGVVSYEATITLNKENERIFSGMTSSIEIIIQEKNDILIVPNLSIMTKRGENFVKKLEKGEPQEIKVEIGLTDGKNTEILSGLVKGDKILVTDFRSNKESGNLNSREKGRDAYRNMMRATRGGGSGRRGGSSGSQHP